ncbi:hypothetical protein [Streptomyces sp. VRA16 Mangrove soil]|uniref:hypothetical protein n=1 Tax=Streptomyces sp. VRA16 Mangrove soil TaxID=2817434 RepID=UPI001A9EA4ED|nr:hypothetical protein [Streptomyces sp. VRA16 Mangrove soil]MBO1333216.1 hypothetical protein [Streptomyces sp. VRA16 Mangrove soil]
MSKVMNRLGRPAAMSAAAVVLSLTASGCVTVHGELEVVPTTTKAEAARALDTFSAAYSKAEATYDRSADAAYVTGPLGAIDTAKLKAGHKLRPNGNPNHKALKLTDVHYTVPKKAGWPRWFVADADNNRIAGYRWVMVFTRNGETEPWAVSYLTLFRDGTVPKFKTDADGFGEAVDTDSAQLAVRPEKLSQAYADYLDPKTGGGDTFADGVYTSQWLATRKKNLSRPGLATQFIDEPLTSGDYAPVALRTADGGALVFFTTRRYEKQTASAGSDLPTINPSVKALMTGDAKQSATYGYVSNQAALDPAKGSAKSQVDILARVEGITSAVGS